MVSSVISESISNPSKEIKALYKSEDASQFISQMDQHFRELLSSREAFYQIPPLTVSHPPSKHQRRGLVRYDAMVQDTSASPEVYLSVLDDGSCGSWGIYEETLHSQTVDDTEPRAIDYGKLRERDSIWAITVPGQSLWARERFHGPDFASDNTDLTYKSTRGYKHASNQAGEFGVNLKVYDSSSLKPGDVKTFVGILDEEEIEADNETEESQSNTVPTLHVLFIIDTPVRDSFNLHALQSALPSDGTSTRENVIQWLANEGLGGDRIAATWVLLLSLAKVQSRSPPVLPPTLTLASFPDAPNDVSRTPALLRILQTILPAVTEVSLSLEKLNNSLLAPTSVDEDLHAGILQHPEGTMMIVTERKMTEGKVTEKGLKNLDALQSAMATQMLSYIFPYSSYPFPIDLDFLVLTRGRKSAFLKTDGVLPLRSSLPSDELARALYKADEDIAWPSATELDSFRDYILECRKIKVSLGAEVGKHIEDEFVRVRRESTDNLSSEDLARRMSIAKLLSASRLESNMTKETWEAASQLDKECEHK